jgi:hypothetical protein
MSRINSTLNDEVVQGIHSVLADAGIEEKIEEDPEVELSGIQKIFKARGAGVSAAASNLASLMDSDDESIRIRATEIALKANGVYTEADKKTRSVPQININILSANGGNTLVNLVMPNQS